MTPLEKLRLLVGLKNNDEDDLLSYFLDIAKDIICEIRYSDFVEPQYVNTQVKIACELYNKMGAEGETGHSENGISRSYEVGDVSQSLISSITPRVHSPLTTRLKGDVK